MNYITTKDQYLAVKAAWASTDQHSASQIIIYNLLRGFDPMRGFAPFKESSRKIESNNNDRWNGFNQARSGAQYYGEYVLPNSRWLGEAPAEKYNRDREAMFKRTFGTELTAEIRLAIIAVEAAHG